jgi:hypothetical protein
LGRPLLSANFSRQDFFDFMIGSPTVFRVRTV